MILDTTTCLNKSLLAKGLFQFPGLRPRLNNWTLVGSVTTSGHINSRVIIYEHGTFQKRKKKIHRIYSTVFKRGMKIKNKSYD